MEWRSIIVVELLRHSTPPQILEPLRAASANSKATQETASRKDISVAITGRHRP